MTPPDEPEQNPFKGTPFEQIFSAMGSGQMPDLGTLMAQMQRLFQPYEGNVNLGLAKEVARETLAASRKDPSPTSADAGAVSDAIELAEQWLDSATTLPRATRTTAAWSSAEWIENTIDSWGQLVDPVARNTSSAFDSAMPEEMRAMAGPFVGMLQKVGGTMFGQQLGQGLAALSGEVVSSTDIGVPLAEPGVAALLPATIRSFAAGLEISVADAFLYFALREAAHQRLFAQAEWLRPTVVNAIVEVGNETQVDIASIESQLDGIDPTRPEQLQELMSSGLFEPRKTPEQQAALERLETILALVEGWVDDVMSAVVAEKAPKLARVQEAVRRRRVEGGPAEQTFASLVGLELRPRRTRDATNLWAAVRSRKDIAARDAVWSHPDLMPTSADLDDPLGFGENTADDFDDALRRLLNDEGPSSEE